MEEGDVTQSTDVTGGESSPAAGGGSTAPESPAAPSVSAQESAGHDQTDATLPGEGQTEGQTQETAEDPNVPEALRGLPTVEELESRRGEQHVEALIRLRTAHEGLHTQHAELSQQLAPLQTLAEGHGGVEQLTTYATLGRSLFDVVRDEAGNVIPGPDGLPQQTTLGFIKDLQQRDPATVSTLARELLSLPDEEAGGRPVLFSILDQLGFVPRGEASTGAAAQAADTQLTPEQEAIVPQESRAAFARLSDEEKQDYQYGSDRTREVLLKESQRQLDEERAAAQKQAAEPDRQAQERQQAEADFQRSLNDYYGTVRAEETNHFIAGLAHDWKPTADESANQVQYRIAASFATTLLDPLQRTANAEFLKQIGVELPRNFDALVADVERHAANAIRLEEAGRGYLAQQSRADENTARLQIRAFMSKVGAKVAEAMNANNAGLVAATGNELERARAERERRGAGYAAQLAGGEVGSNGLPQGMRPGSREAIDFLARQTIHAPQAGQ